MNKQRFIISIIYIILGIQNNVMGANSSNVQIVKHKNNNFKKYILHNSPIQNTIDNHTLIKKMNYNQHLSNKKYYLMMVGNCLNIISSIFIISIKLELINRCVFLIEFILLITKLIPSIRITIILLKDFNKYKKAKNSNDINQYNKYIIDDDNINQLNKQRRYNFINGLSISVSFICTLLIFIKENIIFNTIDNIINIIKLFKNDFCKILTLLLQIIFIITFILQIIYIIFLIKDNKNNIWNSIKNSIHKQDILFYIGYLFFIFIGFIGLYYLSKFLLDLYLKEKLTREKLIT